MPDLVLPLITAHGCYHGQCAFCNVGYGAGKGFHLLPVEQIVERIIALEKKYGVRHIFFADEAIAPRTMRLLSDRLAELGSPVNWCSCARFERGISAELLQGMARGGCRMLFFGLETASERMVQHMVKGTQRETVSRILKEGTASRNLESHVFLFRLSDRDDGRCARDGQLSLRPSRLDSLRRVRHICLGTLFTGAFRSNPVRRHSALLTSPSETWRFISITNSTSGIDESMAKTIARPVFGCSAGQTLWTILYS